MHDTDIPLYRQLVTDLTGKIERGIYRAGERIDSLNVLCARYGVSKITAVRAMDELQKLGLLRKVAGKGAYVTGIRYEAPSGAGGPALRKIVIYSREYLPDSADSLFTKKIYNSIVSHGCELGLDVQIALIRDNGTSGPVKVPVVPRPDEGIIAMARDSVIPMLYLFTDPNCRRVLIDTSITGIPNVLSDNFNGVYRMLTCLRALGHEHILFAARFSDAQNFVNENERLEAFVNLSGVLGFRGEWVASGNFDDIDSILSRPDRPTAVFFSRDDPALKLIHDLERRGVAVPDELSVAGFDDYAGFEYDLGRLSTVRVDTAELGRRAVELLRQPVDPSWRAPLTSRVATELVIRSSCGPAGVPCPLNFNRK